MGSISLNWISEAAVTSLLYWIPVASTMKYISKYLLDSSSYISLYWIPAVTVTSLLYWIPVAGTMKIISKNLLDSSRYIS
jgi:hypothetical protein